jgi:hypothetical protein
MTIRTTGPHVHWHGEPGAVWFPLLRPPTGRGREMLGCCVAAYRRTARGPGVAVVGANAGNDWVNDLFTETALAMPPADPDRQVEMRIWPLEFGGRSCGLALALAEQLCRRGRRVPADTMIVATGTVALEQRGLVVGPIDGLPEKLDLILADAPAGTIVLLPKANDTAAEAVRGRLRRLDAAGMRWRSVDLLGDLADLWEGAAAPPTRPTRAARSLLRPALAGAALGIAALGAAGLVAVDRIEERAWRTRTAAAADAARAVATDPTADACATLAARTAALHADDRARLEREDGTVGAARGACAAAADGAAARWAAARAALDGPVGTDAAAAAAFLAAAAALTEVDRAFPPTSDAAPIAAAAREVRAALDTAVDKAAGMDERLATPLDAAGCLSLEAAAAALDALAWSVLAARRPDALATIERCRSALAEARERLAVLAAAAGAGDAGALADAFAATTGFDRAAPFADPAALAAGGDALADAARRKALRDRLTAAAEAWRPGTGIDAQAVEALLAEIERDGRLALDGAVRDAEARLRRALAAETVRTGAPTLETLAALPLAIVAGAGPDGVALPLDIVAAALAEAGLTLVEPGRGDAILVVELGGAVIGAGADNALAVPAATVRATLTVRWTGTDGTLLLVSADSNGFDPRSVEAAIAGNLRRAARAAAAGLLARIGP